MPIIRTFAPFVAGIGRMSFSRFMSFNLLGACCRVLLLVYGGYFFGNIPLVKDNFGLVMIIIIGVSFIPALMGAVASWCAGPAAASGPEKGGCRGAAVTFESDI